MTLLFGILIGLVTGIVSNLLTPMAVPLWRLLVSLPRRGYQGQMRREIKIMQTELDRLNRHKAASDRDLYLYLFQWSSSIFTLFVAGVACAFMGNLPDTDATDRPRFFAAALIFFIAAVIVSLISVGHSKVLTTEGIRKRTAQLEAGIAKLTTKLR